MVDTVLPPINWSAKDPDEVLDYGWAPTFDAGDAIASHSVQKVSGSVVVSSDSNAEGVVTVWVSGGTIGETNVFTLRVVTTAGRTFETTAYLPIIDSANAFVASFKAAFPAFAATDTASIAFWYARAGTLVTSAYGDDEQYAAMLLTAHYLTLQGLGSGAESQRASKFGGATNIKSGTLSLSWEGAGASSDGFRSTSYGKQFWPFLRVYGGSPGVTNTGTVPYDPRRFPHGEA